MKVLIPNKIFFKIISLMIIISVLPVSILAFFLNRISDQTIRKIISDEFQNISIRASQEIYIFICGTENTINATAEVIANTYSDEWQSKLILRNVVQNLDGFESISFINNDGQEIISSNMQTAKINYSKDLFFKIAVGGIPFYSGIYISDTLVPMMKIAVPIRKFNKVEGVLVAEISVMYLWDLIDNIKIGKTGHAYLVDNNGIIIAHFQKERVLKHDKIQNIATIKNLLRGANLTEEYVNGDGIAVLGSGATVPKVGWGIIIEQSKEEALSLITEITYLTIILVLLAIVLAICVGFFRSAHIVSPIKQLTTGARRVAQGDLSLSIAIESNDEIGELAEDFNKMTSSLKIAQEQLLESEKLAILGRLSAKIAHEVRNPLEAIKGASVFLRKKFMKDTVIQEFTSIIIQQADRLNSFVSEVLSSSKKVEVRLVLTNINAILENICQLVSKDNRFATIKIIREFDIDMPDCFLDPEHLQRAFLNVIINATQAMPNGGEIKLRTKCTTKPDFEDYVEVAVQDTGTGIPDEIRDDVFKPFFTTKRTGTGLGLSYFYETIKQHQGEIKLESELNRGATFLVYIPFKRSK